MKFLITESQHNLLVESNEKIKVLRRLSFSVMESIISDTIDYFSNLCEFDNEFEYAITVISKAVSEFLSLYINFELSDEYQNIKSSLKDIFTENFEEYLLKVYRDTCDES
jgi:hypothetical protein